jgi:hypothetical protein
MGAASFFLIRHSINGMLVLKKRYSGQQELLQKKLFLQPNLTTRIHDNE